jgi:hypothetical protein
MAGAGWRSFTAGAVLTAAQVQTYLQDQSVQVYASAAARSSALGTAVSTGMVSYRTDGTAVEFYNGSAWTALGTGSGDVTTSGTQTLTNKTLTNPIFNMASFETMYTSGTFAGYTFYAGTNGAIQYPASANATANGAVNISWTSGTTLNTQMANNQTLTLTLIIPNGATAYYPSSITIDGAATGVYWQGGTAPTSGNANSKDVYTFVILKASAATFYVWASQTKFA